MIVYLSFMYQIAFNAFHFSYILPFALANQYDSVSVLYLAAALPSFIFTIPINRWFSTVSVRVTLLGSMITVFVLGLASICVDHIAWYALFIALRSVIGSLYVPKLSEYVGALTAHNDHYSYVLQLIMFLPGLLGYFFALVLVQIDAAIIFLFFEAVLFGVLSFILPITATYIREDDRHRAVFQFFTKPIIYFDTFIVTLIAFFSLYYISPLMAGMLSVSSFALFLLLMVQVIGVVALKVFIQHMTVNQLFLVNFIGYIGLILFPKMILLLVVLIGVMTIEFFKKSHGVWQIAFPPSEQSYLFAKRLVVINGPKFIMCLIPLIVTLSAWF